MSNPLLNKVQKNLKHRIKWAKRENISAFRVYDKDIPEYPFLIDLYNDTLIVYDRRQNKDYANEKENQQLHLDELEQELPYKIIYKSRLRQQGTSQYQRIDSQKDYEKVTEHQAKILVNLTDYLDTGLFLDHRPMRQRVFKESKSKEVLNLFSYTCSVSVFAALGGAKVTSVDMSATYINWGKENFNANDIPLEDHKFVQANALEFIRNYKEKKFDLIFLDPPTFSNSKRMEDTFDVQRDQVELIRSTMKLLKEDGVLYFSNNKRDFKLDEHLSVRYKIKNITGSTIPQDYKDQKIHKVFEIRHP